MIVYVSHFLIINTHTHHISNIFILIFNLYKINNYMHQGNTELSQIKIYLNRKREL